MDRDSDIVSLSRLAEEIVLGDRAMDAATPVAYAQPHHRQMALPEYVSHQEGVGEIGVLTSAAMVHQFETAAKAVEAMGQELMKVVLRCDDVRAHALETMKQCNETARRYREEAKQKFDEIEHHALLVQHVSDTCQELQRKIAATAEA